MQRRDDRYSGERGQGNLYQYALYALLVLIWGSTWLVIRISLDHYPPFFTLAVRFLAAGSIFLAYIRMRRIPIPMYPKAVSFYVVVGLLAFFISYGVVYWGEQYVTSGLAAVIFGLFPMFTALCTRIWLKHENVNLWGWLGLALGLGGIVIINLGDLEQMHPKAPLASILLILGPLVTAIASVFNKRAVKHMHPFVIAAYPMLVAGIVHTLVWLVVERDIPLTWSWPGVWATVYLTIPGTLVTFGVYYWLLQHMRVSSLSLIAYMSPVLALILGYVFADETIGLNILLGAALIFSGVAIVGRTGAKADSSPGS